MAYPADRQSWPTFNAKACEEYIETFRGGLILLNKTANEKFLVEHVERLDFNAVASRTPWGKYELCFYDGCALTISELTVLLCARRDFLSFMRRHLVNHHAPPSIDVFNYKWLGNKLPPARAIQYPPQQHINLFNHIHELAIKFLYWHERAHIECDHLKKAMKLGALDLSEARLSPHPVPSEMLRKWEMEADAFAMFGLLREGRDPSHRESAHVKLDLLLQWDCTVLAACAAVCAVFELGDKKRNASKQERTHPSASARFLNLLVTYVQIIEQGALTRDLEWERSAYYTALWSDVLRSVNEVFLVTGARPTRHEDLKGTILNQDENAELSETACEFLECVGASPEYMSAEGRAKNFIEITLPIEFAHPRLII